MDSNSQLKRDDYDRFLRLVEENRGILYKIANSYSRSEADRDDLVQESLVQLWLSFRRYNPEFKFSTWMYRIVLNVSISAARRRARRGDYFVAYDDRTPDVAVEPLDSETQARLQVLERFLASLNELDRALMVLYLEEVPQKEISAILGIGESNVSTKIGRIKARLKDHFSKLGQIQ